MSSSSGKEAKRAKAASKATHTHTHTHNDADLDTADVDLDAAVSTASSMRLPSRAAEDVSNVDLLAAAAAAANRTTRKGKGAHKPDEMLTDLLDPDEEAAAAAAPVEAEREPKRAGRRARRAAHRADAEDHDSDADVGASRSRARSSRHEEDEAESSDDARLVDGGSDDEETHAPRRRASPSKRFREPVVRPAATMAGDEVDVAHTWQEHTHPENAHQFKMGPWTKEEDEVLKAAFDEYCTSRGLSDGDRAALITEPKGRDSEENWCVVISRRFKHRTLRSVFRRAVRLLHPGNYRGPFSATDIEQLKALVEQHGPKWTHIGKIMNRLPQTLLNTWHRVCSQKFATGPWTADEEEQLLALVKKYGTPVEGEEGYKDIHWKAIALELPTRSALQCLTKWNHGGWGMRALGHDWTPEADRALIEAIMNDGAQNREEVRWGTLIDVRSGAQCRQRFETLAKRVPRGSKFGFTELLEHLENQLENADGDEIAAPPSRSRRAPSRKREVEASDRSDGDTAADQVAASLSAMLEHSDEAADDDDLEDADVGRKKARRAAAK